MSDPQPSGGFEWVQAPWGRVLRCRPLADVADHFFTDASLELRDDQEEWDAVASLAGVGSDRLLMLRQVHGKTVVRANASRPWSRPEADAIISSDASAAVAVRVADCAAILIGDTRTRAVAAVHAGWRSTMHGIVGAVLEAMRREFGSHPTDLVVAIGPSLGACCGEMGEEVVAGFRQAGHPDDDIGRWFDRTPGRRPHFDLWRANRDQLERSGVQPRSIFSADLCTKTHAGTFHSYRAVGERAGRMAAVIRPANCT